MTNHERRIHVIQYHQEIYFFPTVINKKLRKKKDLVKLILIKLISL